MAQGDTKVQIDFNVGGVAAAKMAILDIYKSQKEGQNKVTNAAKAFAAENNMTYRDAMRALKQHLRNEQNELSKAEGKQNAEQAKRESAAQSLQAQRSRSLVAIYEAEQREKKRMLRQSELDMKRMAREEIREAKAVAREKARLAKTEEGQKSLGTSIVGRGIRAGILGIAGYAGVAGVSNIFSSISQGMQDVINKRKELEDAITPVVALENNVGKIGSIRKEILSTSLAVGRSYEEVGQFYADLVGSTGNLAEDKRGQLINETKELAELTGGSLVTAQNLLTKSYQIYGKELESVNQLQNKLMVTQDQGSITFEDMGLRLPELLQTGKFANMNIDEVLGTVIGATRKSGSIEKTMTGMRNFFLIMEEAQKKGVTLTGNYTQKLGQLSQMFQSNAPKMQELFGKEVVVHASSVTDAITDIISAMDELGKVTGDTDAVAEKLATKFRDPTYFAMRDIENLRMVTESAPNLAQDVVNESKLMELHRRGLQGANAVQTGTGGVFGGLGTLSGYVGGLANPGLALEGSDIASSQREGEFFKSSMRKRFDDQKAWDMKRVELSEGLMFGPLAGLAGLVAGGLTRKEVEARTLSPHLMTDEERATYQATGVAPTKGGLLATAPADTTTIKGIEDKKTHELLAEIRDRLPDSKSKTAAKPGGGKTNSEEAI
jgi:hypothetical protein